MSGRPVQPPGSLAGGPLAPGQRFGGVRIERLLARGATAHLYLATAEDTGAPLAVKATRLPDAKSAADPQGTAARSAFEQQARQAMALQHPGIVKVYGIATGPGLGCTVMELLPGTDLSRYTHAGRLLPEGLTLEIAARLAEALAHAHRQGMVHRDVKPANVMFDSASVRVVLTDFGLARAHDAEATRSGLLLGSPAYMAPELLAGARADAHSDLYALGVLLFELLTGSLPYEGDSMGALLRAMAAGRPRSVGSVRADLDAAAVAALDAALARVWHPVPAERCADGNTWAAVLRALAGAHFSHPAPPSAL